MYFKINSLLTETTKKDFENNSNISEIGDWGKSEDLETIKKALIFVEKGLEYFGNDQTKSGKYLKDEYSSVLEWSIAQNINLDEETIEYIYDNLCLGSKAHLNSKIRSVVYNLAANPATPQEIKDKILQDHTKIDDAEFVITKLASNINNSPEFIEDIYKNHQGRYIEFRSGMGCSWLNEKIAGNPNTSESLKNLIIEELPNIIETKSKELHNMYYHPSSFNNIFKAMAENPNTSEEVLEKLYDAKDNFSQKMDYTYYVALNTKNPALLDKIAKDGNNYNGIYQALLRNSYLKSETVDYIVEAKEIPDGEKSRLAFNPSVLNSNQLAKIAKTLGNYGIKNVEEILNYPICNEEVCNALLENYYCSRHTRSDTIDLINSKKESLQNDITDLDEAKNLVENHQKEIKPNIDYKL